MTLIAMWPFLTVLWLVFGVALTLDALSRRGRSS